MKPDQLLRLARETNSISDLIDISEVRSPDQQAELLLEIAAQSCRTLNWVEEESDLAIDVGVLVDQAGVDPKGFWEQLTNDARFEELLGQEARMLRSIGTNDSVAKYMLDRIRELRAQIRAEQAQIEQIPKLVAELRGYVCGERDRLRQALAPGPSATATVNKSRLRRVGGAVVEGLVGVSIAGGNGAAATVAFFATLGLSAPLSAAAVAGSGALGGALIGDAVTTLRR